MFRRKSNADAGVTTAPEASADLPASQQPKGRPTPTRKEAEAARKAALQGTTDPKAATKEARESRRQQQVDARAALVSGDENRLPLRDKGPVKAWVRDRVDGRISIGEVFIPVAVLVLVLGFVRVQAVQVVLLYVWAFMLIGVVVDSLYLWWVLRRGLAANFPDLDPKINIAYDAKNHIVYGTKGALFYGIVRSLQMRLMRLPKPKVRWNGAPKPSKAAKAAKAK